MTILSMYVYHGCIEYVFKNKYKYISEYKIIIFIEYHLLKNIVRICIH